MKGTSPEPSASTGRELLRLAGGDGNAILVLAGLVFGIWIGTLFLKGGYNLGRTEKTYTSVGWLLPLIMAGFRQKLSASAKQSKYATSFRNKDILRLHQVTQKL